MAQYLNTFEQYDPPAEGSVTPSDWGRQGGTNPWHGVYGLLSFPSMTFTPPRSFALVHGGEGGYSLLSWRHPELQESPPLNVSLFAHVWLQVQSSATPQSTHVTLCARAEGPGEFLGAFLGQSGFGLRDRIGDVSTTLDLDSEVTPAMGQGYAIGLHVLESTVNAWLYLRETPSAYTLLSHVKGTTSRSDAGQVGLARNSGNNIYFTDWFGVGTQGDLAPGMPAPEPETGNFSPNRNPRLSLGRVSL